MATDGLVTLPSGITFNGGAGRDVLAMFASAGLLTGTAYNVGQTVDAGSVVQTSAGGTQTVSFTGLEPVVPGRHEYVGDFGVPSLPANALNADNAINYTQGPAADALVQQRYGSVGETTRRVWCRWTATRRWSSAGSRR